MPRSRTDRTGVTVSEHTKSGSSGIWCCRRADVHHSASDLSALSCNRFDRIHMYMYLYSVHVHMLCTCTCTLIDSVAKAQDKSRRTKAATSPLSTASIRSDSTWGTAIIFFCRIIRPKASLKQWRRQNLVRGAQNVAPRSRRQRRRDGDAKGFGAMGRDIPSPSRLGSLQELVRIPTRFGAESRLKIIVTPSKKWWQKIRGLF